MNIKINANDIYKITKSCSCDEMQEIFESLPDELQIFAKYQVGAGFFHWILPGDGWPSLAEVDELDAIDVKTQLNEKKKAIKKALSSNCKINVDNIFTTPGENGEYIFFRSIGNDVEIKIVAWDYKFPVKTHGAAIAIVGPKNPVKQNVVLVFTEAGVPAGKSIFSFKTYTGRNKTVSTNENERFIMGSLLVGKTYEVSVQGLAAPVKIVPEAGKEEYVIDITRPYTLNVSVTNDGCPVNDCVVSVNYLGEFKNLRTSNGNATFKFPYKDEATCLISVESEQKQVNLDYPSTDVKFEFKTSYSKILLEVFKNNKPYNGACFEINYNGQTFSTISDNNGQATYSLPYLQGKSVKVSTNGQTQSQTIDAISNQFTFNIFEDIFVKPYIRVVDEYGSDCPYYPLIVNVNNNENRVETNGTSLYMLPDLKVGQTYKVVDGKNLNNYKVFTIEEGEEEYIFHINTPVERCLEFTVQDDKGNRIPNQLITLVQGEKEASLYLDDNGQATLSRDIFAFGKDISSNLNINGVSKATFDLQLDEDEDEYLLEFSTKERRAWWLYLLDALFILLLIFLVFFFWFFINVMLA